MIAANIAIGGISAALPSLVRGKLDLQRLARGTVGGFTMYLGKRLIAEESPWASWSGRSLAAVGASEIRNAETNRPILDEVVLPAWAFHVYLRPRTPRDSHVKIDLAASIASAMISNRANTWMNIEESAMNGTVVFNQPYELIDVGAHAAGVVRIEDIPGDTPRNGFNYIRSAVLAHEIIHAAQNDFAFIAWSQPVEQALFDRKGWRWFHRYLDVGLSAAAWQGLASITQHRDRPWEKEAGHLSPGW